MSAPQKMDAFGMKDLETRTGKNLVTLYRWRRQLLEGEGIRDKAKRVLIDATADSDNPITWEDFIPSPPSAAPTLEGANS